MLILEMLLTHVILSLLELSYIDNDCYHNLWTYMKFHLGSNANLENVSNPCDPIRNEWQAISFSFTIKSWRHSRQESYLTYRDKLSLL